MALWTNLPGVQPPTALREFKGVNKQDAFSIGDGYATNIKNLTSSAYPAMTVRPPITQVGQQMNPAINGIGVWKDTELHALNGGVWNRFTGSSWLTLATSLNQTKRWSFCNFQGNFTDINLLAANGTDPVKKYDGSGVSNLANAPAGLNYIDTHDNRVYGVVGNSIKFSALRKATDWSTVDDAGEIVVESPNGEKLSGLKAGPGHVVGFKPHSMHELYGTGPINYRLMPVSDKVGTDANGSILSVDGVLYFKGLDSVYQYAGGAKPRNDFALPAQWYIDNINKANAYKSVSSTDGKRYYLAIPVGTATEPDTILEYDPQFGTWNVWSIRKSVTALVNMQGTMYAGTSDGYVYSFGGTSTEVVDWLWESKPFGSGPMSARKNWYKLWYVFDLPTGSTCNVYLSDKPEGEDWMLVKSVTASNDIQSSQVIIPVGMVANKNWMRVKFTGTGPATMHELTHQERVMRMGV